MVPLQSRGTLVDEGDHEFSFTNVAFGAVWEHPSGHVKQLDLQTCCSAESLQIGERS
jgi:hypothetical protein